MNSSLLSIVKANELSVRVETERAVEYELMDTFSFYVPGFKYQPKFKSGLWDGKIRLYNSTTKLLPMGLIVDLAKFCHTNGYELKIDPKLKTIKLRDEIEEFASKFGTYTNKMPEGKYQFQADLFRQVLAMNKALVLSPTGSGKSSVIYLLTRFLLEYTEGDILITVPSLGLISQLRSDFQSYVADGFQVDSHVVASNGQAALRSTKRVLITNWHAIVKQPLGFFDRFESYICDEAHLADSMSITSIVNKLVNTKFRFGFTGTLDGSKVNEMSLKGMFGPVVRSTTTKELIKNEVLSDLQIKVLLLQYPKEKIREYKAVAKTYNDEIDWLVANKERNEFLVRTALEQKHNTMVLFTRVGQHGVVLYNMALQQAGKYGKTVFIISGDTVAEKREEIRQYTQNNDNVVLFASYATTATGTNIPNLHTIIFAHPHKGRIRNLQSIGRGLRKHGTKDYATLIDVGDSLTTSKRQNITLRHLTERLKLYVDEGFPYSIQKIELSGTGSGNSVDNQLNSFGVMTN